MLRNVSRTKVDPAKSLVLLQQLLGCLKTNIVNDVTIGEWIQLTFLFLRFLHVLCRRGRSFAAPGLSCFLRTGTFECIIAKAQVVLILEAELRLATRHGWAWSRGQRRVIHQGDEAIG